MTHSNPGDETDPPPAAADDGNAPAESGDQPAPPGDGDCYLLRLYVAGHTSRSAAALANLQAICEKHLEGRYRIEVIDLLEKPQLAAGDQIVAIPTLVRRLPPPLKRLIGNLADSERVLVGLDIRPEER
jgi:circadian clock protein KaiB